MKSSTDHFRRAQWAMFFALLSFQAAILSGFAWAGAPASTFWFLVPVYVAIALAELWLIFLLRRQRARLDAQYRQIMNRLNAEYN